MKQTMLSLVSFAKNNKFVILLILIVLPKVIVKSSLPPNMWDEMAYHFISPYTLFYEKKWIVENSFYQNLPRLLETAYILLFSLTKSYSVARLLHFSIFITFILSMYSFLNRRFGYLTAIIFAAFTLYHPENFLLWSTYGYVDVGTMSFTMIGFIYLIKYIIFGKLSNIIMIFSFFGMAVGSKYSALTQFLSFVILLPIILHLKKETSFLKSKKLLLSLLLFTLLGGYWYIKNLSMTGNPIFPFLFGCKFDVCESVSLAYTSAFNIANARQIYSRIFFGNKLLEWIFPISIVITTIFGSRRTKIIQFFVLIFVFIEILLVKSISGYDARYFYHWQILAMLILVLPAQTINISRRKNNE